MMPEPRSIDELELESAPAVVDDLLPHAPVARVAGESAVDSAGPYRMTVCEKIRDVDLAAWNSLRAGPRDPFTDVRFLEGVEVGMAAASRFWHVLFYDAQGRPAASASLCSYRVDAALLADGLAKSAAQWIARLLPRLLEFRVLFCGVCFSAGQSNLRIAPGVDASQIIGQLDEFLTTLARQERAKCIVFKEFRDDERAIIEPALTELGYQRADSLPMNQAHPIYRDFADFLAKQKSNRRYVIRKAQKRFAAGDLRVVQMRGGEGADRLFDAGVYRLFETVFDRATVRLEKVSLETFQELARKLPDETMYTFVYSGEQIVAFAFSVFTATNYHQIFVGYDATLNAESDLYFNVFFHALDHAYRQHGLEICVGQSADDFKHQKLGAHQHPLYFFIRGADAPTRWVLKHFGKAMFPARFAVAERNGTGELSQ